MAVKFSREIGKSLTGNEGGDPVQESAFTVEVAQTTIGGVNKVEGLDVSREVVQGRDGEDNNQIRARMGNKSIINFSLTRDLGLTTEFYDWFKTGVDGAVSRRPCTITSFTDTHEAASQIHLFECWVKSYEIGGLDGTGNGHAWEKIECVAEDINYA